MTLAANKRLKISIVTLLLVGGCEESIIENLAKY